MTRDDAINILREHREDLARYGVKTLALFGSVVRDEALPESDVDILVDFREKATFAQYMDLKFFLEDLLGRRVDLVTRKALKTSIRPSIEQEAVYVA